MKVHGFNKTTLLDYPEYVAATVFTGGCNFRCPFCHNGNLVLNPSGQPLIPVEEILEFLRKRQGILEGVCITGGEPTLQRNLPEFIHEIKDMGFLVKLDTNGYNPQILWKLLQDGLLDYVAMDVKASKGNYGRAAGVYSMDISRIEESIAMLKSSEIAYEFRTTMVKGIHSIEEFDYIGKWLAGSRIYFLQQFRESDNVIDWGFAAFSREEMKQAAALAGKYIGRVELRGVE